jgi:mannose-1-phosphate guanylyltransferase
VTQPDDFYAVIPAGGSGTRLWPLSRRKNPKFLQALGGTDRSLLQATVDRLLPLVPAERIFVVTGTAHAAAVARQLPDLPDANLLVEPSPRDSAAAIALACQVISRRSPDAVVGSFAADHVITDPEAFRRTVAVAIDSARGGQLMTIGITPSRPETGYGYVECSEPLTPFTAQKVLSFREKPPSDVAAHYVAAGRYLWNAGMFVWNARLFLDELARRRPDVSEPTAAIGAAWAGPDREARLTELWPTVARVAVDYAVLEPAAADGLVGTVPGDFGWSDIGDFETIAEVLGRPQNGAVVVPTAGGSFLGVDSDRLVVMPRSGRLIAALGVEDLIIVDTDDAVLVCRRDRAQDVKRLTELLHDGAAAYG